MNNIREQRENLGLTIKDVAEMVGVHFTTVSEWELGKITPRLKKKIALAESLNTTQGYLFPPVDLPEATHQGILTIGEKELNCAVLGDGTRIITMTAVFEALGRSTRSKINVGNRVVNMPSFVDANNLQPFISKDLMDVINLIEYRNTKGQIVTGYDAKILPLVCDAYLGARADGALTKKQLPVAAACEILVRSFAKIGIIALVDEATGYQAVRERNALNKILESFIAQELQPWVKTFPDEFYQNLFRLRGWQYKPLNTKRPSAVAYYTVNLIYERLAPGVLDELKKCSKKNKKGKRKNKLFQHLTPEIGHPKLKEHISSVMALQRACGDDWELFMAMMDRALPKYLDGKQLRLFVNPDSGNSCHMDDEMIIEC